MKNKKLMVGGLIIILFVALVMAAQWYRLYYQAAEVEVDEQGTCKTLYNGHASGDDIFVPTATAAEWLAFRTYSPSGVQVSDCATCTPFDCMTEYSFCDSGLDCYNDECCDSEESDPGGDCPMPCPV